jgi:hypothetical protein
MAAPPVGVGVGNGNPLDFQPPKWRRDADRSAARAEATALVA